MIYEILIFNQNIERGPPIFAHDTGTSKYL